MAAIELDNIYKSFDGLPVLRGLSLRVEQGEIYGLLGTNGAGKSTLMHLLLGFLRPQHGQIRVLGTTDLSRNHGRIGYLPERLRYHLRFTAREYLRYLGQLDDLRGPELLQRVDDELATVGLSAAADRTLGTYSRGMLQRVGIAQALLHNPALLLIDEPTGGLDPDGQRGMLELLAELRQRGCAVLLATHYLDEIEQVCDRVGVLYDGKIAAETVVSKLQVPSRAVRITVDTMPDMVADRLIRLSPAVLADGHVVVIEPNSPPLQARVLRVLLDADIAILALEPQQKPLAELFARVTRGEHVAEAAHEGPVETEAVAMPPNTMFAPPGHPDALPAAGTGDTLLSELLSGDNDDHQA